MTTRIREPFAPEYAAVAPVRQAGVAAGVGLLLMTALAVFANFVVLQGVVTDGDAAATATDIMGSEGMFRLGTVSWLLIAVLDVVVAWALLAVFSPVSRSISMLAAWFRLAYAGVLVVAISQLAGIPRLLGGDEYAAVFTTEQLQAEAMSRVAAFTDLWSAGLLLFGIHLLIVGYLAYRSGYVPRLLGVLLAVAGLGYAFDSLAAVVSPDFPIVVSSVTFFGEFCLACWLVFEGLRKPSQSVHGRPR